MSIASEVFCRYANRSKDCFGRVFCHSDEMGALCDAIREAGLDMITVRYYDGGGDDSYQLNDREVVATFSFPWEKWGTGSCGVDVVAVNKEV